MKRKIWITLILLFTFTGGYALATSVNGQFEGNPIVKVFDAGKELVSADVPAIIYHNRTMVPLILLQQAGYRVTWNPDTYSVTIDNRQKLSRDVILKMKDGIGIIYCYDASGKPAFQGTSFVIDNDLLLTAYHVTEGCSKLSFGNIEFTTGDIVNKDLDYFGVRLNKLPGHENDKFVSLKYSPAMPQDKDKVYALGYPKGVFRLSEGYTHIFPNLPEQSIESSAIVDGGSSGGILANEYGEVIGITTNGDSEYSVSLPMLYIQRELDKQK